MPASCFGSQVMQLYGVVALAPSIARLKNLGALEDRATAIQELCAINRHAFTHLHMPALQRLFRSEARTRLGSMVWSRVSGGDHGNDTSVSLAYS